MISDRGIGNSFVGLDRALLIMQVSPTRRKGVRVKDMPTHEEEG